MTPQTLTVKVALKISAPVYDVFEAIVDPIKMKNYFISESTGRMEEGKTVTWKFLEMDLKFPVRVGKIEKDKFISFSWDDFLSKEETKVEITLTPKENNSTFVHIT